MKRFLARGGIGLAAGLAACFATVPSSLATSGGSGSNATAASPANPYAAFVVQNSNDGLEEQLIELGVSPEDAALLVEMETGGMTRDKQVKKIGVEIPDISTTGFLCQLLTLQPAQGCLETQLSNCTQQSWCTSLADDECTNGDWCTAAAICTNTQGCTDAGVCTAENGCTGTNYCTASAGCTQHGSCTNGHQCTDDHDLCTGSDRCTIGTGCTNGTNCTGSTGCTNDAQCTDGASCTTGTNCTDGTHCSDGVNCATAGNKCTQWTSCKSTAPTPKGPAGHQLAGSPVSGVALDAYLASHGVVTPEGEPHLAPERRSLAHLGWLGVLLLPGLALRRRVLR